jgi:CTP synthase (UTP-ammonia lyase)
MKACEHCGVHLGVNVNIKWLDTTSIDPNSVTRPPRLPRHHRPRRFRRVTRKTERVRYAREKGAVSRLCLGFRWLSSNRRNVCGLAAATESIRAEAVRHRHSSRAKLIEGLGGKRPREGHELKPIRRPSKLFANATVYARALPSLRGDPVPPLLEEHGMIFSGKHLTQLIMQIRALTDMHLTSLRRPTRSRRAGRCVRSRCSWA